MAGPGDYADLTQLALDARNHVDPRVAAYNDELVIVKMRHGRPEVVAHGRKVSYNGHVLVLAPLFEGHDEPGDKPILGTAKAAIEPGGRPLQEVKLVGLRVLDGRKYAEWQTHSSRRRSVNP